MIFGLSKKQLALWAILATVAKVAIWVLLFGVLGWNLPWA